MTMLTDIAGYLETQGHGVYIPDAAGEVQTIFVEDVPESPDLCIMLFQSGGMATELTLDGAGDKNPSLQVRVRSAPNDPGSGITKIEAIAAELHGLANVAISGTQYKKIRAMAEWGFIGFDRQDRPERSQNFQIMKA